MPEAGDGGVSPVHGGNVRRTKGAHTSPRHSRVGGNPDGQGRENLLSLDETESEPAPDSIRELG